MASADATTPDQPKPTPSTSNDSGAPQANRGGRGRGRGGRGRGRGRGGGRGGHPAPRAVRAEDLEDGDERAAAVDEPKKYDVSVAEVTKAVESLKVDTEKTPDDASAPPPEASTSDAANEVPPTPTTPGANKREKGKAPVKKPVIEPYVNHARINTGGLKNDKLSKEELDKVMERMRQKNQEILARREQVEEDQYKYTSTIAADEQKRKEEAERRKADRVAREAKDQKRREVQQQIDTQRSEAVQRKLSKQEGREWDAVKGDEWANSRGTYAPRGGGRGGRGRGGGRGGRGGGPGPSQRPAQSTAAEGTSASGQQLPAQASAESPAPGTAI